MINTTTYIQSGVLEDYLSGNVSDQERREVECLSKIYPELQAELNSLEVALERFTMAEAVKAPASMKAKLMAQLEIKDEAPQTDIKTETPIIALNSKTKTTEQPFQWGWVAAAAVVVMVGFGVYSNGKIEDLNSTIALQSTELNQKSSLIATLNKADNQFVTLKGLDKSPNSSVRVVWNATTKEVSLSVNSLPVPDSDKQYQLWALVDGKPVDLGVFDVNDSLQKMKLATRADAFAVTLEKKGGSPSPTLAELYVMGKVS